MFQKLNRKDASLARMTFLQLRAAIMEGRLKPNQSLQEEQLAAEFDISRTPLREALAMLESEGLVEAIPYRGTFVTSLSRPEYVQSMEVREQLEPYAVELAIDSIPAEEIDRVEQLIIASRPLLTRGDIATEMMCQEEFHSLAPRFSGNHILEQIIYRLQQESHRFRRNVARFGPEHMLVSADEHLALLDAYRRRDRATAVQIMRQHFRDSSQRDLDYILDEDEEE